MFILLETQNYREIKGKRNKERGGWGRLFHLLVHPPNHYNDQIWAYVKVRANSPFPVFLRCTEPTKLDTN